MMTRGMGVVQTRPEHCATHGDYEAILITLGEPKWTGCPVCAREAVMAMDNAALADEEAARSRDSGEALARVAGIPRRHAQSVFDSYDATPGDPAGVAFMRVWDYATGDGLLKGDGLLLQGTTGTGKTHLACALVHHVTRERLLPARYVIAANLFRRVRAMYTTREETERDILEELVAPALLVIDEIGEGSGTEHDVAFLSQILSRRYDDMTATVLVTNLTLSQLKTWFDSRGWDRLRDTARAVTFDWDSHRGRA
jgi:DNA replication protein DnaC